MPWRHSRCPAVHRRSANGALVRCFACEVLLGALVRSAVIERQMSDSPIRRERPRIVGLVSIHAGIQNDGLFFDS
jgi:hypothetical protein